MNQVFTGMALGAGLLALWVSGAFAGEFDEDELEEELFFESAEMVTSAALHAQPIELSPSAVTVLTREDIESSGARTLPEVLRLVPNMDIAMVKPFWYVVGVRGATSLSADTMLLLVDGRDLTLEFFGFPGWAAQHFSIDDVERIEVFRGPGSALYGANAYSGVVHVVTRAPGTGPRAQVSLRGGQDGFLEVSGRGSHDFGAFSLAATAGLEQEDFWTDRGESGRRLLRGRLDAGVPLGPRTKLKLEAGAMRASGNMYTDLGTPELNALTDLYGRARFEHGTEYGDLQVQLLYDRTVLDVDVNVAFNYGGLEIGRIPAFENTVDKIFTRAQYAVDFYHNRLTAGSELVYNLYQSNVLVEGDLFEWRISGYAQDELHVSDLLDAAWGADIPPLILTVGLRYDYNHITRGASHRIRRDEWSPRASLVFVPWENHSFRAGYAHAYLKPTFFESSLFIHLESDFGFDTLDFSSPELDNETIDSIDLGYQGSFRDNRLIIRLDLAYNWYRNFIDFRFKPDDIDFLQIGTVRVPNLNSPNMKFSNDPTGKEGHNLELQVVVKPTDRSRVFLQAGYRQLFDSASGDFKQGEPVFRLAAGADLKTGTGFAASLRAFFVSAHGSTIGDPEGILVPRVRLNLPASWFLNARLAWTLEAGATRTTVGLEAFNLLDFRFREYGGITIPNGQDHGGELLGRRIVLFVQGEI